MDKIPFISVGQGELDDNEKLKKGDVIQCPHCTGGHPVVLGRAKDDSETDSVMYYNCGETTYLCGVNGIALFGVQLKKEE